MKSLVTGSLGGFVAARRARLASHRATRILSAILLCAVALSAPGLAYAAHGGGGGGGFHGGGIGGFHAGGSGGFHAGGVGAGFHGGGIRGFHGGGIGGFHGGGMGDFHNHGLTGSGIAGSGFVGNGLAGGGFRPEASFGAGMARVHSGSSREASGGIVLRGGAHGGHWQRGWHDGRYGWWWGSDPYLWSNDGLYDDSYGDGATDGSQSWYCSDPAGYYPSVSQCNTAWQSISGN